MGDILDEAGHKVAKIGQDGIVKNVTGIKMGTVKDNGDVLNKVGQKIGSYDGSGNVYEAGRKIGSVHSDGKVFDYELDCIGSVKGDHIISGGAALLLLVR